MIKPGANKAYVEQIQQMAENAKKWLSEHPDEEVLVEWPNPKLWVIQPISNAIIDGNVRVNEAAKQLILAMWPQDVSSEPTVTMAKVAFMEATKGGQIER